MAKMNLYLAGGAAVNIGKSFAKFDRKQSEGFAEINTFFIDTSRSNLTQDIPSDRIYLVDGVDGSGKKRDSNYSALAECSKEILHKFKPADVNVVISSASGGTGSTVSPILVSELLARGETVVVIAIGSTSSRIETENTLKTLKSYEMISRKREAPVIVYYRENSAGKPRGFVDSDVYMAITLLAAIFSGSNKELDSSDLKNFLNYHRVTTYMPKLSMLDFFTKDVVLSKGQTLVSLVTLVDDTTTHDVPHAVEYQATGYIPDVVKQSVSVELPIHACIVSGYFNTVVDELNTKLAYFDEVRQVAVEKHIVGLDHQATDDGLIL